MGFYHTAYVIDTPVNLTWNFFHYALGNRVFTVVTMAGMSQNMSLSMFVNRTAEVFHQFLLVSTTKNSPKKLMDSSHYSPLSSSLVHARVPWSFSNSVAHETSLPLYFAAKETFPTQASTAHS